MIPKVIHYCWFGRNPLPESAIKCINSWRKFFPDYEIKEWNEDNFDVNVIPYTAEAYVAKKYAFVSDYARFWILYHYGGLYFDTDVEVIKPMDDIIERGAFMGIEVIRNDGYPLVNPGQGLASNANMGVIKQILDYYNNLHFLNGDGSYNMTTIVRHTTEVLVNAGMKKSEGKQAVAGIWIYPRDFFNPLDDFTGKLNVTANTRTIHWYSRSWSDSSGWKIKFMRFIHVLLGENYLKLRRMFTR